jgi:hypothetical protein
MAYKDLLLLLLLLLLLQSRLAKLGNTVMVVFVMVSKSRTSAATQEPLLPQARYLSLAHRLHFVVTSQVTWQQLVYHWTVPASRPASHTLNKPPHLRCDGL